MEIPLLLESLNFSTLVSTNHMPHSAIVRLHMILSNREGILLPPIFFVTFLTDSCHSRVIQNQQYLYPKFPPTIVVKLLQYSGSRVELRDGFSSYK